MSRLLTFGRSAEERLGRRPETFDFLGFKHVCGKDLKGRFALIRIPSTKSCRKFLHQVKAWLAAHPHWSKREQQTQLAVMLRGFYQYFSLPHSQPRLKWAWHQVHALWLKTLWQQSQRSKATWKALKGASWFRLPRPSAALHPTV